MRSTPRYEAGVRPDAAIPLCEPELTGREWAYVKDCLDTGWVSSVGSYVTRFEELCARITGSKFAVATVNGTAALHVALLAAGVAPDDEVLVSTLTFIAPANAIRYASAWPVFVDCEPAYWQIDVERLADFLAHGCVRRDGAVYNADSGRRVRAILPVSILGHPVDLDPILSLAAEYGLRVIEDATESFGARYKHAAVGGRADVACLSFNGNKLITTGGGGMIVTNDEALARNARYLTTQAKDDPVEYIHGAIGFNYRLTNIAAAVGCAQLEALEAYVCAKVANARCYRERLSGVRGVESMREAPWATSVWWLFTVSINAAAFGCSSRDLLAYLAQRQIQARPLWQPMHRSPAHAKAQHIGGEVADRVCRDALSLPSSVGLTRTQLDTVVDAVAAASLGQRT